MTRSDKFGNARTCRGKKFGSLTSPGPGGPLAGSWHSLPVHDTSQVSQRTIQITYNTHIQQKITEEEIIRECSEIINTVELRLS